MRTNIIFVIAFGFLGNACWAGPFDPIVSAAWVGESIPGQTTATLQLNLTTVKPVKLMSVTSPLAGSVEIHSLMKHKGAMSVQIVDSLQLPEHRTIIFGSRGLFLMMTGIKQQLNIGDKVPVNLMFAYPDKQTKTIAAVAEVRKMELSYKHYGPNEVYDHH